MGGESVDMKVRAGIIWLATALLLLVVAWTGHKMGLLAGPKSESKVFRQKYSEVKIPMKTKKGKKHKMGVKNGGQVYI